MTQYDGFVSPRVLAGLNEQYFIAWASLTAASIPAVVCSFGKPFWRSSLRSCLAGRNGGECGEEGDPAQPLLSFETLCSVAAALTIHGPGVTAREKDL